MSKAPSPPLPADERPGIQSVEIALELARTLVESGGPLSISEIAGRNGMHRSKAHRYFVSLCRSGLAEQDSHGAYRLGPLALRMGLAALNGISPIAIAGRHLERIAGEMGKTIALAMWADGGPIYVDWKASTSTPVTLNIRLGSTMPMIGSAAGRLFGALLAADLTRAVVDAQLKEHAQLLGTSLAKARAGYEAIKAEVVRTGIARVRGDFQQDIDALCAPVFDHHGKLVLGLTVLGASGSFEVGYRGAVASDIKRAAEAITRQLGGAA